MCIRDRLYIDDLVAELLDDLEGSEHHCIFSGTEAIAQADGRFCYVQMCIRDRRGLNARILPVLFLGIFVSAWTECLQFATGFGYFDVDDLIYNTAGCMAGIWTWRRQRKKGVL